MKKLIVLTLNKFFQFNDILKNAFDYFLFKNKKGHSKFLKSSKSFWKSVVNVEWDGESVILCEVSTNIYLGLGVAILANIIAKVKGARVLYFNARIDRRKYWFLQAFSTPPLFSNYSSLIDKNIDEIKQKADAIFKKLNIPADILNIEFNGIGIGDLIYDEVQRSPKGWKASVWKIDAEVYLKIFEAIKIIYAIDRINEQYKIVSASFTHTVGIHSGGLILRYLSDKGVEVYCGRIGLRSIKKYTQANGKIWISPLAEPDENLVTKFLEPSFKTEILKKSKQYLHARFDGSKKDSDSSRAYSKDKKLYKFAKEFCEDYQLTYKPTVFVMLHAFNDFPHHYQNNLFTDYYRWFIHTLKLAQQNDTVNWVFKEHPSAEFYPDDANLEGIFQVIDRPHITFLNRYQNFNSLSLKYIAHTIITCVGTAGLEFSCFGIPVILGGENYYSKYGIGKLPKSIDEYNHLLLGLGTSALPEVLEEKRDLATILFYIVFQFYIIDTPYNNRFIPFHNIEIARENNLNKVIEFYIKEISDPSSHQFIKNVELFIKDSKRTDLVQPKDILEYLKYAESNISKSVTAA